MLDPAAEIVMDGASLLKTSDGSLVVRKRAAFNWTAATIFALALVGALAFAVSQLASITTGSVSPVDGLNGIFIALFVVGLMTLALWSVVGSLRAPSIHLNAGSKVVEIGRGRSARQIPFSKVAHVVAVDRGETSIDDVTVTKVDLQLILDDDQTVPLGSLSGQDAEVRARAENIAQLVSNLTGAKVG